MIKYYFENRTILISRILPFEEENKKRGRPETPEEIKKLVLRIKNDNVNIGYSKIVGELKKLGITLDETTVRKILNNFRKKGKVKSGLTWKKFIKTQIGSLFAMDFFMSLLSKLLTT